MGTRGLLGFLVNGVRRGSYNHFDSYPSGLGAQIAKFILSLREEERKVMAARVAALKWVDWNTTDQIRMAEPLRPILDGTRTTMPDESDFIRNGLFCEWAYYIDFDNKKLEIWGSGQHLDTVPFADLTPTFMDTWDWDHDDEDEDDGGEDKDGGDEGGEGRGGHMSPTADAVPSASTPAATAEAAQGPAESASVAAAAAAVQNVGVGVARVTPVATDKLIEVLAAAQRQRNA